MPSAAAALADTRWHVIDAEGKVLGRIATTAARLLQGKHKATYTPFIDTGDHVVVVNAAKVKLTGRKEDQKIYRRHSGYEGGLREERARVVRQKKPTRLVEEAVHGMLPKTKMGEAMYQN
jgi:large subunit ribosomal protein L13